MTRISTPPAAWTLTADGACLGNPGPGGWGAIVEWVDADGRPHLRELGGSHPATTNNRMELMAVLEALRWADRELADLRTRGVPGPRLRLDSKYVLEGLRSWVAGWEKRGWVNAAGAPVANREIWEPLIAELRRWPKPAFEWVKGHSGDRRNERADTIATDYARGSPPVLRESAGPRAAAKEGEADEPPESVPAPRRWAPPTASGSYPLYLSLVSGKLERHSTWAQCEAATKGKSGARFKKVKSADEEAETLAGWGA